MKPITAAASEWDGPMVALHLRSINGVPCLFDEDGRMVGGLVSVTVTSSFDSPVTAKCEVYLEAPPAEAE